MRKKMRGSLTIEAAVIVPIILWIFAILVILLFYYHDKNVVTAVAHEAIAVGCGCNEMSTEELEKYFHNRLSNKMLLFPTVSAEAKVEGEYITLFCEAKRKGMHFRVQTRMKKTNPESVVRRLQKN